MADNLDLKVSLEAFSKIIIEKWQLRMIKAGVGTDKRSTKKLFQSFSFNLQQGKIDFTYLKRGHYVDRGAGREVSKGNSGNLGFTPRRKAKKWFYAVFMSQARALERIMSEKFGIATSIYINESWKQEPASKTVNKLAETRRQELELMRNWVQ